MNIIFIVLLTIGAVLFFVFINRVTRRSAYIKKIVTKYPIQVSTHCGTVVGYLDTTVRKEILTLTLDIWIDWTKKIDELTSCSKSYSEVMSDYILYYFPNVKDAPHYKNFKVSDSVGNRCKILIECLQYDDILKLCQITHEEWSSRQKRKSIANAIVSSNPDAINELLKKFPSLRDEEIINHRKRIEQIQQRYIIASSFDAWIVTQKAFNTIVRSLRDDHAQNCGCCTYEIGFQKPLSSGKTSVDKVSIWQIFPYCISPYLKEYHSILSFSMQENITEFKMCKRSYSGFVYDGIIQYIRAISSDKTVLVVFNNSTSYNWDIETYDFHYLYFRCILSNENIPYVDMEKIPSIIDGFNFDIVLVFDFITVNKDLVYTSKMLIESFSIKIPNIVWYSMIKEYDEVEMKDLYAYALREAEKKEAEEKKSQEKLEKVSANISQDGAIAFIKKQLLEVNKHPFFSYYAIPNILIGEAANSKNVKRVWLPSPEKFCVKSMDKPGYISVLYSIDGGLSWTPFEKKGNYRDIDDVVLFTYELFIAMGVLEGFITNGSKAISCINGHQYLARRY